MLVIIIYSHSGESLHSLLSPAIPERAPNWIVPKTPWSAFSFLQLGYEPKKNGEQNTERAHRTLDNVYFPGRKNLLRF